MAESIAKPTPLDSSAALFDRELSWLAFARRVLAVAEDPALPLLERVKFAGIIGMLHDEFFVKRISGIKRRLRRSSAKQSTDDRIEEEKQGKRILSHWNSKHLRQVFGIPSCHSPSHGDAFFVFALLEQADGEPF